MQSEFSDTQSKPNEQETDRSVSPRWINGDRSEQIDLLATALSEAQKVLKNAAMNRTNVYYKSKYATLSSVWDAVREALPPQGLSVTQSTRMVNGGLVLITTLFHKSGQYITSDFPIVFSGKPQDMGSQLTYVKRYQLCAIVGLAADEDDDGNAAQDGQTGQISSSIKRVAPDVLQEAIDASAETQPHPFQIQVAMTADESASDWVAFGRTLISYMRRSPFKNVAEQWRDINDAALRQMEKDAPKAYTNLSMSMVRIINELDAKEKRVTP